MLCVEVFAPKLELIQSIFYVDLNISILCVQIGKFHNDIFKFSALEMQNLMCDIAPVPSSWHFQYRGIHKFVACPVFLDLAGFVRNW
jgi:hypothetical protein